MLNVFVYVANTEGSEYLQEAVQLSSPDSSWSATYRVEMGTVTFDWLTLHRRLYDGLRVGPTIHVKRGDQFTLNLVSSTRF